MVETSPRPQARPTSVATSPRPQARTTGLGAPTVQPEKEEEKSLTEGWYDQMRQHGAIIEKPEPVDTYQVRNSVYDEFEGVYQSTPVKSVGMKPHRDLNRFSSRIDVYEGRVPDTNLPAFMSEDSVFRTSLGKYEAEGYNTLFGNAQRNETPFAGTRVTDMTISDLIDFTSSGGEFHRYNRAQGHNTTAVGKYQLVGKTLRWLYDSGKLEAAGISDDTLFSPETQDKIAVILAQYRVRPDTTYSAGRRNLRNEWEGFKRLSDNELDAIIDEIRSSYS